MINTDCFFTPAQRPKKNCQDYALCGHDPIPYTILCDGCSSSRNTDVGARLLAFAARRNISDLIEPILNSLSPDTTFKEVYKVFGLRSIFDAWKAADSIGLNKESLDSTLIVSFFWNNHVYCFVYGDGTIIASNLLTKKISFEGNAPYYLSYQVDSDRASSYWDFAKQYMGFVKRVETTGGTPHSILLHYDSPIIFKMETKLFLSSTDGIDSLIDFNTVEKVPISLVSSEFCGIKNTKGEFIKRRVRKALEEFNEKNIYLSDDLSIGAILIE